MKLIVIITFCFLSGSLFSKSIDLSKLKEISADKRPKVVLFLSASCPCSQKSLAHLEELSKKYGGYDFYGINETAQMSNVEAHKFFKDHGIDFKILDDPKFVIADLFAAVKTPHAFILNEFNEVIYEGGVANLTDISKAQELFLSTALSENFAKKTITRPTARTLGCYIKRD